MTDSLAVFLHDDYLGDVVPFAQGRRRQKNRVRFQWDSGYQPGAITLTESFTSIPGREPDTAPVSNFFGGYTPDGNHREAMAALRGIDHRNLFSLLREFGGSLGGALTFRAPDEASPYVPRYIAVDDTTVAQRLLQAVERHDLGIQDESRSMLPGFQPKLLLARFGSQWHEPHGRAHSTHILKPQLKSRPHQIYNEHYSHQLARAMGLSQFGSEIMNAGQSKFLSIKRFDRLVDGTAVSLVHQEDAAQALGLDWQNSDVKFQDAQWPTNPARPSVRAIAELTGSLPNALAETSQWLRQLVFHVLIGDSDAHAKNVGFIHESGGTRLSELYDAVPNLYQAGRINWDMAMAIDGDFDHRKVSAESIAREAASWSVLRADTIEGVIRATLHEFVDAQASVTPLSEVGPDMVERLSWNAQRLIDGNQISAPKETR
ncbi:type II toxin-antitoxin system HipA family toxin [Rhodoglobus aureus]|uniref:Type II toxin-antitoxin system HipA family toxin n=1 Tax=Rhodoglobus aureus TaxID=191497 RepID=A0ABN1VH17_9MICO